MALPKEIEEIITTEEAILSGVLAALESQSAKSSQRLRIESVRARELTAEIVALRRDEEKQLLASDEAVAHGLAHQKRAEVDGLDKLIERPYFARLVVEENTPSGPKQFEYRIGEHANTDCRIIDWRHAPIAKLYYEYREGDEYAEEIQGHEREGTVILRHALEVKEGQLRKISCKLGTFVREGDSWVQSKGIALRSDRQGALPDVLPLITAEQFRTITEEATSAIFIQGIAGSGKTTVALHRLSWIIKNGGIDPSECAVIVKSRVLRRYIENSLAELGLNGVKTWSFADWGTAHIKRIRGEGADDGLSTAEFTEAVAESIATLGGVLLGDSSLGRYRHLVIDELQDFEIEELALLARAVSAPHEVTLAGDLSQDLSSERRFPGWERILAEWKLPPESARYLSLAVSHRSTLPIMKLAEWFDRRAKVVEGRAGRVPIWFQCGSEGSALHWAKHWLEQAVVRYPGELTAVLCRTKEEAKQLYSYLRPVFPVAARYSDEDSFIFHEGIVISSIATVKGLEFNNLLLWNPNAASYPRTDDSRALLYVGVTRAAENLAIVTSGNPSALLPPGESSLVRLVAVEG